MGSVADGVTMLESFARVFVIAVATAACTSGVAASEDGKPFSIAVAAPLLEACRGSYACVTEGSREITPTSLVRSADGKICTAGKLIFNKDSTVTDASDKQQGTWSGDAVEFKICDQKECVRCRNTTAPPATSDPSSPSTKTGSCTGSTSCGGRGAGDCSTLQGCYLDSHAVYHNGTVAYYEHSCSGSTPSCSDHDNESKCKLEECSWKR